MWLNNNVASLEAPVMLIYMLLTIYWNPEAPAEDAAEQSLPLLQHLTLRAPGG